MSKDKAVQLNLPSHWQLANSGADGLNGLLSVFDWNLKERAVAIDFRECSSTSYQALSLLVLYVWHLQENGCPVDFLYDSDSLEASSPRKNASQMWHSMGANRLFDVRSNFNINFNSDRNNPLLAIRNNADFRKALEKVESYAQGFEIEVEKIFRYAISELLYNTLEHGNNTSIPSLIQLVWSPERNELSFIVADLGVGIRRHLRQTYSHIEDDVSAIEYAIRPQVSGTFSMSQPYKAENNAGVGLYLSSSIIRKLNADMHIVSGNGAVHILPTDVAGERIEFHWPGTLVEGTIGIGVAQEINFQKMMSEFRASAAQESISQTPEREQRQRLYLSIRNYFGRYAEDKTTAIQIRERQIIPAVADGKSLTVDFDEVISAPHSFLNALLASPIRQYGMAAYKKIKIINAAPEIRETIDFIMDANTVSE